MFNVGGGFQYWFVILLSRERLIVDIHSVSLIDHVYPIIDVGWVRRHRDKVL